MVELRAVIADAQVALDARLLRCEADSGFTRDRYIRYLSAQYHLSRGVQRSSLLAAAHPSLRREVGLRRLLLDAAVEEAPHFAVALHDLATLGVEPLAMPYSVAQWHARFQRTHESRPFLGLGAWCARQHITVGSSQLIDCLVDGASYLNANNTAFLQLSCCALTQARCEELLVALGRPFGKAQRCDLVEGANTGLALYLAMIDEAFAAPQGWSLTA